jgi:hypothetical protein
MAPIDNEIDNEYVRRVGFALSYLSDNPRAKRLNPFAWLPVAAAAGFAVTALLAYLR